MKITDFFLFKQIYIILLILLGLVFITTFFIFNILDTMTFNDIIIVISFYVFPLIILPILLLFSIKRIDVIMIFMFLIAIYQLALAIIGAISWYDSSIYFLSLFFLPNVLFIFVLTLTSLFRVNKSKRAFDIIKLSIRCITWILISMSVYSIIDFWVHLLTPSAEHGLYFITVPNFITSSLGAIIFVILPLFILFFVYFIIYNKKIKPIAVESGY